MCNRGEAMWAWQGGGCMDQVFAVWQETTYISSRQEILWNWDSNSVEPVTLSKYLAEYELMWKWMVEFLSKLQGSGIKIDRVNSIRVAKSIIFFNICRDILHRESSWAIIFFALSLSLLPLVYILCSYLPTYLLLLYYLWPTHRLLLSPQSCLPATLITSDLPTYYSNHQRTY